MLLAPHTRTTLPDAVSVGGESQYQLAQAFEMSAFYGLLVVIVLAAIPYGTVEPWSESLLLFLISILSLLRILEGLISGAGRVQGVVLLAPLVGLLMLATIQIIPLESMAQANTLTGEISRTMSFDPFATQRFIFQLIGLLLGGELLLRYTNSERRLSLLVHLVIAVGLASAIFGIARQLFRGSFGEMLSPYLVPEVGYAQFINRNHFSYLMEMTLGVLVGLILKRGVTPARQSLYVGMAAVIWVALVLANSRGGLLSMIGLLLFAASLHLATRQWNGSHRFNTSSLRGPQMAAHLKAVFVSLVAVAVLCGVIVFAVAVVGGDPVVAHLETVPGELRDERDQGMRRTDIWHATWELTKEHPFVGVGFGAYGTAITKYDRSSGEASLQQAHNDYLEILASGGMFAAALILIFIVGLIWRIRRELNTRHKFRRAASFGAAVGLFAVALHSVVDFGLHTMINALFFLLLVVIASAKIRIEKSGRTRTRTRKLVTTTDAGRRREIPA